MLGAEMSRQMWLTLLFFSFGGGPVPEKVNFSLIRQTLRQEPTIIIILQLTIPYNP